MSLLYLPQPPVTLVLIPFVVSAAYDLDAFAVQHFSRHPLYAMVQGPKAHQYLQAGQVGALHTHTHKGVLTHPTIHLPN